MGRAELKIRTCSRCGLSKPIEEFCEKGGSPRKDGIPRRYAYCKPCHANNQRSKRLADYFLLSVEEADKIFAYQGNVCAICKRPVHGGKRLALDHRHSDGLIRGGLCNWCNRAIARFAENIIRLRAAADYLENPPAIQALGRSHYGRPGRVGTKKMRLAIKRERKQK